MVTATAAFAMPASPPLHAGGDVVSRDTESGDEGRSDFGALLAGLVAAPQDMVGLGAGDAATTAGAVRPDAERGATGDQPTEPVQVAPLPAVPSSPPQAPEAVGVEVTASSDVSAAPRAMVARSAPADGVVTDDVAVTVRGDADPASLPHDAATPALPIMEAVAAEIVKALTRQLGRGAVVELGVRAPETPPRAADAATAGESTTDGGEASRPMGTLARVPASLGDPLAGLRELVRGPSAPAGRATTERADAPVAGGGGATAEGVVSSTSQSRPSDLAHDAPRSAPSPAAVDDTSAAPAGQSAPARTGAAVRTAGGASEPAEVVRAHEDAADAGMTVAAEDLGGASGGEAVLRTVSGTPLSVAGAREAAAPTVPRVTIAPPPTTPAPTTPPAPTSHATLDLALGDGTTGRLRVAVRGDVVHATILAEGTAAMMLERELPSLRRSLTDRGFADAQLTVRSAGGDVAIIPPPPTSGTTPDRPTTGRDRDEGAPRQPHPDRQDPTEDQRSRERRRPPQPEEYP